MRLIEITFPETVDVKPLLKSCLRAGPVDHRLEPADDRGRRLLRLVVLPVEASLPLDAQKDDAPVEDEAEKKRNKTLALREELYEDIAKGAVLDRDFLLLTALSAVVAAVGLNANNVAAVIGAMVIAPLLGPILAFAFGSALGDLSLMTRSARTASTGLVLGLLVAMALGAMMSANLGSDELVSRTFVGVDSVALALAAGAAAALSMSTGVSSALVGVMVAVALLPPSAAVGLFVGAGEWGYALRAALLLAINVVSVLLAALFIFRLKGVRPRTWLERRSAKLSVFLNYGVWVVCILVLTLIAWRIAPVEILP